MVLRTKEFHKGDGKERERRAGGARSVTHKKLLCRRLLVVRRVDGKEKTNTQWLALIKLFIVIILDAVVRYKIAYMDVSYIVV